MSRSIRDSRFRCASTEADAALGAVPDGRVVKLNDQHAFLVPASGDDFEVGDVVEFGISHPCTCLDRYRFVFGLDENGVVRHAYPTYFG